MTQLRAMALVLALSSGCATTSGRDWLRSPIEERGEPRASEVVAVEAAPEARPRLSHTVTLGESYAAATPKSGHGAPSVAAVQVNVQTQVPMFVSSHHGGYGYGYGYGNFGVGSVVTPARASRGSAASQKVGADFPPVPDYGPPAMR